MSDNASHDVQPGRDTGAESADSIEIVDRPDRKRYEILVNGQRAGVARYVLKDGLLTLTHTEVDPAFAGRGLGRRLASHVLDDARARGLRVRPECSFMAAYIASHHEYGDLVTPA